MVFEAYKELLQSDRSLLVPVLGSLSDLPLSADQRAQVRELALVRNQTN